MDFRNNFIQDLFKITDSNFNIKALELFKYQYKNNTFYRKFVNSLHRDPDKIEDLSQIPFLPIEFYKSQMVITGTEEYKTVFFSSGTTDIDNKSKHFVKDPDLYEKVFTEIFIRHYGNPADYIILALLPSYQENKSSSLIYMVDSLIRQSGSEHSGFISLNFEKLLTDLPKLRAQHKKIMVFGVAYALLELAEQHAPDLSDVIIIETGGMKGRREEMIKAEMHEYLKQKFQLKEIHSEYGMTELLSQAYSLSKGIFKIPFSMKVLVRDVNDALTIKREGRGGINIIDLANIDSCAFIETQDMGMVMFDGSFEVMGRMDNSDVRGCNLLYSAND